MTNKLYKGETLRFHDLIKKQKVEIPIIQRDYAQGRIDAKEVRINFLKALYDSLNSNNPIKLDFIYGSNVNNSFQPLDGQQRLTTLFLLHWYAATIGNELSTENRTLLSKFSYETRITSREFCLALVSNPINVDTNSDEAISTKIIDSNWFFLSWKNDPTIDSMLRTIDDIHKIFSKVEKLWDKLTSSKSSISFYYVELENIGLTDDLYIKMNARGKLLTSFENFKATFQKYIDDNKWEDDIEVTKHFALKIDTCWTDYFWHNFKKNNSVDEALMRFIATNAMVDLSIRNSVVDDRILKIRQLQEQPDSVRPEYFSKEGFLYLVECFEIYEKVLQNKTNIKLPFPFWRHKTENSILSTVVYENNVYSTVQTNSATYTQKVLFFAQTEYLRRIDTFNESNFQDWMRVIRNIVSRGSLDKDGNRPDVIRSPETFDGVVNLINELAKGCENIYLYLSELSNLKSQFSKDQIEEEKNKAKLIVSKPHLKQLIFNAEDNELLSGRIEFIFYTIDYDNVIDNFNESDFSNLQNVFATYFNTENSLNNDLRRALLAIEVDGNYEFYNYWWSYWNIIGATKRRLFERFRELEYYIYSDQKVYFKKLVLLLVSKSLKDIAYDFNPPDDFPNWKKRLIKEPELLDNKGKSHYLAIVEDNSCCYLLKSKRPRDIDGSHKIE
ncbi:MAG: hypothetical protein A2W91_17295 [Bacteroidetes bacterium GWF2_38_335]|nr:MAG: hypothetical protein A2W91_17295 [Bacteroidetes bacterium GWF2_38_335]OFY79561.1 MAG: hypothetical protein A2281_14110 [Bacteroidetes bacterium RIFOXYA12_FULL_38_20]HBS87333.1 DUF262 domain-containing protein [Bacteroidales bacterium]